MDEAVASWYFSTNGQNPETLDRRGRASARVAFDRRKYGRHLLIDVAWVHELPGIHRRGRRIPSAFFDVILVTRGTGWFWLDSHRHAVRPGTVFFTTPGQVRRWDTTGLDGVCLFFEDLFIEEFLHDEAFLRSPSLLSRRSGARRARLWHRRPHAACGRGSPRCSASCAHVPPRQRRSPTRAATRDAHRAGPSIRRGASRRCRSGRPIASFRDSLSSPSAMPRGVTASPTTPRSWR